MPLDDVGRRYAERLYQNEQENILREYRQKLTDVRLDFTRRNLLQSGMYPAEYAKVLVQNISALGQAKADTLCQAYEKSGIPFDDAALREISTEVVNFCWTQQHHAIRAIGNLLTEALGSQNQPVRGSVISQIDSGTSGVIARLSRNLSIRRDEAILKEGGRAAELGEHWDVFISHASEDKDDLVRPLAAALEESGLRTWFDETTLTIGDSLRAKIDEGLSQSRYGIVVLSKHFFAKDWPQNELDGLMAREISGNKVILPIWHNISREEVVARSPILAGRLAARSDEDLQVTVRKLRQAMGLE